MTRIGAESLQGYLIREQSLYQRSPELQSRFASPHSREYQQYVDANGILYFREMQELAVPFPSWQDMLTVGGETDLRVFLNVGLTCYEKIFPLLPPPHGRPAILDFGIGCARTMRFFYRQCGDYDLYGCDVDRSAIAYLQNDVHFVRAVVSDVRPPLPYADSTFQLAYCISVFTHFTEHAFGQWLEEIRRVLKPEGRFALTLHGRWAYAIVDPDEQRRTMLRIAEPEYQTAKPAFQTTGFLFAPQEVTTTDIDQTQYGINFIDRLHFEQVIQPRFELESYEEAAISRWQDLAVLRPRSA